MTDLNIPEKSKAFVRLKKGSDIRWTEKDTGKVTEGYGYEFESGGVSKVALIRCPNCSRENYAPNVVSGICTWCGWEANK